MMLFKLILSYIFVLIIIYFCNNKIMDLLGNNQALIKFIELTLPLTIPALLYFFQVNKDKQERLEKEKQKEEKYEMDEKDKFEKSLPFFYIKNEIIFARNPQNSPILNVKIQIANIRNDFMTLGELNTSGAIHSENSFSIGGLVDGDEINLEHLLGNNNIFGGIRWFVLSAITVTNDIVYFVYLPCIKTGWHFYRKTVYQKSLIVKYIGDDDYCELAKSLINHVSVYGEELSYKESILNDAIKCLDQDDLKGACVQLIVLVREVKALPKSEVLFVLHNVYLMLHQLDSVEKIRPDYFRGNFSAKCDFTEKYKNLLGNVEQGFMMREYLQDILILISEDRKVSLDFWLRNLEVFVRDHSRIFNARALRGDLERTIPPLAGGVK